MKTWTKLIFTCLMFAGLALVGCKKDSKEKNQGTLSMSWKFGSNSYKALMTTEENNLPSYFAVMSLAEMPNANNEANTVAIYFRKKPTTSKNYKIVYKVSHNDLLDDEIHVSANELKNGYRQLYLNQSNTAKVTVEGKKITIDIPKSSGILQENNKTVGSSTLEANIVYTLK
jgi:hypothetical protein